MSDDITQKAKAFELFEKGRALEDKGDVQGARAAFLEALIMGAEESIYKDAYKRMDKICPKSRE